MAFSKVSSAFFFCFLNLYSPDDYRAVDGGSIHKEKPVFSTKNGYESNLVMKKYKHYISNNCTSINLMNLSLLVELST